MVGASVVSAQGRKSHHSWHFGSTNSAPKAQNRITPNVFGAFSEDRAEALALPILASHRARKGGSEASRDCMWTARGRLRPGPARAIHWKKQCPVKQAFSFSRQTCRFFDIWTRRGPEIASLPTLLEHFQRRSLKHYPWRFKDVLGQRTAAIHRPERSWSAPGAPSDGHTEAGALQARHPTYIARPARPGRAILRI